MDTCVKNISKEDWTYFKSEAVKHDMPMGKFFSKLVHLYQSHSTKEKNNWDSILHGKKLLSDKEARGIMKEIKAFRKETEFR